MQISNRSLKLNTTPETRRISSVYSMIYRAENDKENICLSKGDPYFPPPAHIKKSYRYLIEELNFDDNINNNWNSAEAHRNLNFYRDLPMITPRLMEAAHEYFSKNNIPVFYDNNNSDIEKNEITVGIGTTQLCISALFSLTDSGEKILVPCPTYGLFNWTAEATENPLFYIESDPKNDYKVSAKQLESSLLQHKDVKCILFSNPNNPTGSIYTREEFLSWSKVLSKPEFSKIAIISDEVYDKTFLSSDNDFVSFASLPNMYSRTITLSGTSKNLGLAKERIGIACGPAKIISAMTDYIMKQTGGIPELPQLIAADALRYTPPEYFEKGAAHYLNNLRFLENTLIRVNSKINQLLHTKTENYVHLTNRPQSGFFVCIKFPLFQVTQHFEYLVKDDFDLFYFILRHAKVICVPGSSFGFKTTEMIVRLSLAKKNGVFIKAIKQMEQALLMYVKKLFKRENNG